MKRRALVLTLSVLFLAANGVRAQVTATNDGAKFQTSVGVIVKWLNPNQDVEAPTEAIADWNNAENTTPAATDSIAILRLVTNVDVRLTGTAQALQHASNTQETLATFVCIQTDGDGTESGLTDGTGDPATGFAAATYAANAGIGPVFTGPQRNFVYVGGGSQSAGTSNTNVWNTAERMTELSGIPAMNAQFAFGTMLGASGAIIKHVSRDGAVLIRVTVRGLNGEDFGPDSDDTEAPDASVESPYQASVSFTALP